MTRFMATLTACACVGLVALADEPKPMPKVKGESDLIPDLAWVPKAGDRVVAWGDPPYAGADTSPIRDFEKFRLAKDQAGMKAFLDEKTVTALEPRTELRVIKILIGEGESYYQHTLRTDRYPIEVRILTGKHKDRIAFMDITNIASLVPKPAPKAGPKPKEKPKSKPVDPAVRAKSLLRSAQVLEKSGKTKGAVEFYKTIVKDYPKSAEAKTAGERLDALKP